MDEDEGGGGALKKKKLGTGEVDFKEKAGTAWSHNFLNQKPWHPLSYPNQRRKWIAEQTDAQRQRRAEEVAREFAQEQEFFRQTALVSKKEKEKVEIMKAVSFMYVRPPGYNAESAKAAELEDEKRRCEGSCPPQPSNDAVSAPSSVPPDKKKSRPKDVFGRTLPTEEEFDVLKNAPRMETGLPARVKPFGIEVRNVKCLRCGNYGHQSGDRECPLKDAIMPNEENRLKRDDPLTSIMAHTDSSEPLKWELKQKPGMSPPRGGFKPDDPNQQIVAEDIFDEYGGFLSGGSIPELLTNFSVKKNLSVKKSKKHSKRKTKPEGQLSAARNDSKVQKDGLSPSCSGSDREKQTKKRKLKEKHKRREHSSSSDSTDIRKHNRRKEYMFSLPSSPDDDSEVGRYRGRNRHRRVDSHHDKHHKRIKHQCSISSDDEDAKYCKSNRYKRSISREDSHYDNHHKRKPPQRSYPSDDSESDSSSSSGDDSENDRYCGRSKHRHPDLHDSPHDRHHRRNKDQLSVSSDNAEEGRHHNRNRRNRSVSPDDSYHGRHHGKDQQRSFSLDGSDDDRYRKRNKHRRDSYYDKHSRRNKQQLSASSDDAEYSRRHHEKNKHRRRRHGDNHRSHKSD